MNWSKVHIAQFLLLISFFKESLSEDDIRLPKHMIPTNYNLTFIPNYYDSSWKFDGEVVIQMLCQIGNSTNITLHAARINIISYNLTQLEVNKSIAINKTESLEDNQIVFKLEEQLETNSTYSLFLKYKSIYSFNKGFTRSIFIDPTTGVSQKYYFTSLPRMKARTVFPCFDEPAFKATFDLTLARIPTMNTLSNMPHRNISIPNSKYPSLVFDEFQTTPNMSTHVLGFYISTFSNKTAPNISSVDIKMWAPNNLLGDDNVILLKAGVIYKEIEQYLNTTQPIEKQDLVHINKYENTGADSWGIINFDPKEMYIGKNNLPHSNEKNLITMAHRFGHQWFGNLVTPSWWKYLWLNEGPSTFMSYFVLRGEINKIWDKFSLDVFQKVLIEDSSSATNPLVSDSYISYYLLDILSKKGACIIRMLVSTFGEDVFQKGSQEYLKNFSFRNVEEDDLWSSLQIFVKDTNISVKDIMSGWTNQSGYPLVTVNVSEMCRHMTISQKRFFLKKPTRLVQEQFWKIPFPYQVINIDNDTVVSNMSKLINQTASTNISDTSIMNNTLVIANVATNGYFRVNYDKENWNKIIQLLRRNHTVIHVLNRAQFMDDAFSFVRPEIEEYTLGMNISTYLLKEKEELPWLTFFEHLKDFYKKIIHNNRNSTFMSYLKNVTSDIFNPFNQTELQSETSGLGFDLKIKASKWACLSGNEACINWAIQAFDEWRNLTKEDTELSNRYVNEYLLTIICSKLINNTDNDTLMFVLNQRESLSGLKDAISCIEVEQQIRLLLDKDKYDLSSNLISISKNYQGRNVIRDVLQNITTYWGSLLTTHKIYSTLSDSLERSATKEEFNKTKTVFESIVNWPQFNGSTEAEYKLSAIQEHIQKVNETWLELKGIEDRVISVVLNP